MLRTPNWIAPAASSRFSAVAVTGAGRSAVIFEPHEDGTLVTSYYDWSEIEPVYRDANIFPIIPEAALRATLGILARTVEN